MISFKPTHLLFYENITNYVNREQHCISEHVVAHVDPKRGDPQKSQKHLDALVNIPIPRPNPWHSELEFLAGQPRNLYF